MQDTILFTPASLIDLLAKIDELKDVNISITETFDGDLQLNIGESVYIISSDEATDINVDESTAEKIDDINYQAYEDLDDEEFDVTEPIESGIIKELAKTLLVGGLVRLTSKLFRKKG